MKAMIFAAGFGSRLEALTKNRPKALVYFLGKPLIEHLLNRLIEFGIKDVIVNIHHFADQIIDFIEGKNKFGINIKYSLEHELLDTGGGLRKVASFFNDDKPFLVHNVDIISNIDYGKLLEANIKSNALSTLAVNRRNTSRYLLFDDNMNLEGWESVKDNKKIIPNNIPYNNLQRYAFTGIQIISPKIFSYFPRKNKFSIIEAYLNILQHNGNVSGYDVSTSYWFDLGTKEKIAKAEKFISDYED